MYLKKTFATFSLILFLFGGSIGCQRPTPTQCHNHPPQQAQLLAVETGRIAIANIDKALARITAGLPNGFN